MDDATKFFYNSMAEGMSTDALKRELYTIEQKWDMFSDPDTIGDLNIELNSTDAWVWWYNCCEEELIKRVSTENQ